MVVRPNILMGQRFLASRRILDKMIAAANLAKTDTVLEIGSGRGALTFALAEKSGLVIAVEKDKRLFDFLTEKLKQSGILNVSLIVGDILKTLTSNFQLPTSYKVVANMPYYLTGRLLRLLLTGAHPPKEMFLMVQREVAERITAKPPKMNLLALAVQAYGQPEILFQVPASAFSPPPKVDSAFIRIRNIGKKFFIRNGIREETLFRIAQAAFRGRRKTLENSLARNLKMPKAELITLLRKLGLPGKRPEALSLEEWGELTRALKKEIT